MIEDLSPDSDCVGMSPDGDTIDLQPGGDVLVGTLQRVRVRIESETSSGIASEIYDLSPMLIDENVSPEGGDVVDSSPYAELYMVEYR